MTKIREELEAIRGNKPTWVAEEVVEWAREHPDSALHGALTWDDAAAGHQWRVWQVRRLIALHVVNEDGKREAISLTIDRVQPGGGYRLVGDAVRDVELRKCMLADALTELRRVRAKYRHLKELAAVFEQIDLFDEPKAEIAV